MEKVILKKYVKIRTGKLDANASEEYGIYPFFTCAREISRINVFAFNCECVLVAGNGELNVKYYDGKFNAYQRTYVIESLNKNVLSVKYLYYFIYNFIEKLRNGALGGLIKYIKLNQLTDIELLLPDIETQNNVVAILDKAKGILDKRAKTISKYDTLLKAIFQEMFGDPVTNPKGWKLVDLNQICTKITDGTHKTQKYLTEGIKIISAKNIVNKSISWLNIKYVSETESSYLNSRCNPEFQDILLTKSGSLGQLALIDVDFKFTLLESLALIKYRRDKVLPSFLITYLMSDGVAYFYKQRHKGIAVKHINLVDIKSIPVYLPSIELQKEFEVKYNHFQKLISVAKSSNFKGSELLKSLNQNFLIQE